MVENIKAGDLVFVVQFFNWSPPKWTRVKVERTTKTQVIIEGGDRFLKGTGRERGQHYIPREIRKINSETEKKYLEDLASRTEYETRRELLRVLLENPWERVPTAKLERIVAILREE